MTPCQCPCPSGLLTWLKDYSFAGGWLLVIVGWLVVNWQTNRREQRKEIRALIDSTEKLILEIEVTARDYYALPGSAEKAQTLALQIKASFRTLSSRLTVLKNCSARFNATEKLIAFRTAVTGGDFESSIRPSCPPTHRVFSEISAEAGSLVNLLNEQYAER